jgi:hypothetical protein
MAEMKKEPKESAVSKPVSLVPLTFDEVVAGMLATKPPEKEPKNPAVKKKAAKKR